MFCLQISSSRNNLCPFKSLNCMIRTAAVLCGRGWAEVKAMSPSETLHGLHRGGHKRPGFMVMETGGKGFHGRCVPVGMALSGTMVSILSPSVFSTLIHRLKKWAQYHWTCFRLHFSVSHPHISQQCHEFMENKYYQFRVKSRWPNSKAANNCLCKVTGTRILLALQLWITFQMKSPRTSLGRRGKCGNISYQSNQIKS